MTKKMFVESKYLGSVKINKKDCKILPKRLGVVTTVQFVDCIPDIKKQLKEFDIIVSLAKQKYPGQILGCDISCAKNINKKIDAFLYFGTGDFHPISLSFLELPVYILNPFSGRISIIDGAKVDRYKKRLKAAKLKFYSSDTIGILVSNKLGQKYSFLKIEKLKKKYKDKKFYTFICDTINLAELENFPFIEAWVNTACPRLEEDYLFVNVAEIM